MKKIEWKNEYCGLEIGIILLVDFFGPKPSQTTQEIIQEVKILSPEESFQLFLLLGGADD